MYEQLEMSILCLGMLIGSHTLKWQVGVVFIGPNPIFSRWTESISFRSMGTSDRPVRTGHCTFHCPVPTTSADHWDLYQSTVGSDRYPDSPVHTGQFGATPQGCLSMGPSTQTIRLSTGQSGAHWTVTVHCSMRHQALPDCPFLGFLR
jgi:hypothetical protein